MTNPYAQSIWYDKYKADEAECKWQEHLASKRANPAVPAVPCVSVNSTENGIWYDKYKADEAECRWQEHLASKKTCPAVSAIPCAKVTPTISLVDEIARTREHIKHTLQSSNVHVPVAVAAADPQVSNRVSVLEKENQQLRTNVSDLQSAVKKLEARIAALETSCKPVVSSPVTNHVAPVTKPTTGKPETKKEEDDDDDIDLFGSDEDEGANDLREKRLQEYAAKKSKKPQVIAKSSVILDVKPWDDETDMAAMEVEVRKIAMDGLLWGASKLVPLAYGIRKLQICCVVEDEKVSIEELQEKLEAIEDLVQSVDIAAFNKI